MYDAIPHYFRWVVEVFHHTFSSFRDGNRSVDTDFTHTNAQITIIVVYDGYQYGAVLCLPPFVPRYL